MLNVFYAVFLFKMICAERQRLLIEYRDATHQYSERVRDLVEVIGLEVNADLNLLRRKCVSAWDAAEKARLSVAKHEANHFCDRTDFVPASAQP